MLFKCVSSEDIKKIVDYIGDRYKEAPYLYVNLHKYGYGNQNVDTYYDCDNNGEIIGCYLKYYDCMHFFTRNVEQYPTDVLFDMVQSDGVKVIIVPEEVGKIIEREIGKEYVVEKSHIIDMDKVGINETEYVGEIGAKEDLDEIAALIYNDPFYKELFVPEVLKKQYHERFDDGFSRFFIERIDGKIVAACSTSGEVEGFALLSGVIVHPDYRRRGLAMTVENYACSVLEKDGLSRVGFVSFDNIPSLALHEALGAFSIAKLYKFLKVVE